MNYYKRHLGDYARKAGHLSMLEHGAYNLILDAYYDREQAPTKAEAMRWARARNPDETQTVSTILQEFFVERGGRYYQQRVEDELREAREKAERNRIVGKFGGRPPRTRKTQTVSSGLPQKTDGLHKADHDDTAKSYPQVGCVDRHPLDHANCVDSRNENSSGKPDAGEKTQMVSSGLPDGFQAEPQSTNPLIHNLEAKDQKKGRASALVLPDWLPADTWADWHAFRNARKGWTPKARTLSLRTLSELRAAGQDPRRVIEQSIERGWTGLFPIRDGTKPPMAQQFSEKTYTGTPDDELPAFLRADAH